MKVVTLVTKENDAVPEEPINLSSYKLVLSGVNIGERLGESHKLLLVIGVRY